MKKVICGILSIIILSSSLLFTNTAFATDGNNNSGLTTKEEIKQRLYEKYGEDPFPDAENSGSWGFENSDVTAKSESLIPGFDGSVASPLWSNQRNDKIDEQNHAYGTHGYIIEHASKESNVKISKTYINLVYETSKLCDRKYDYLKYKALHGKGNYIASIMFLWRYARLIGLNYSKYDTSAAKREELINTAAKWAYDEVPALSNSDNKAAFTTLYKNAPTMVKSNYKVKSDALGYEKNQSWHGRCKYIIYGMILHCIGDTYSHMVMFKTGAADKVKERKETGKAITLTKSEKGKYLDPSYFNNKNFSNTEINNVIKTVKGDNTSYPGGIPMYLLKSCINDTDKHDEIHKAYADNPQFYEDRVYEAINASIYFLENYKVAQFHGGYVAECLKPILGFKLWKYSNNKKELNIA